MKTDPKKYLYRVVEKLPGFEQEIEIQASAFENKPGAVWTRKDADAYVRCETRAPEGTTYRVLRRAEDAHELLDGLGGAGAPEWKEVAAYALKRGKARRTDLQRFAVRGLLTISVHTTVLARTKEGAIRKAKERGIVGLCHQCAGGEPTQEWVTSGELDGLPDKLEAELDR